MVEIMGKAHVRLGEAQEDICLYPALADVQNQGLGGCVNGQSGYMQYGFLNDPLASRARLRIGGATYALLKERSAGPFTPARLLQVSTGAKRKGSDCDDLRDVYIPAEELTYKDAYKHPVTGKKIQGEWSLDENPPYIPAAIRESMYGCVKGMAQFTFVGRTVSARLLLDWEQGSALVFIDGKAPSAIPGLSAYNDKLICDLDLYNIDTEEVLYKDIVIADGLPYGAHTCMICANNAKDKWFNISAVKVRDFALRPLELVAYHEPYDFSRNAFCLRFLNRGDDPVKGVAFQVPAQLCKRDGSSFGALAVGEIGAGKAVELAFAVDGERISADDLRLELAVSGDYEDENGFVSQGVQDKTLDVANAALQFQPAWWKDADNAEKILVAYSEGVGQTVKFACPATRFTITVVKDWGLGRANVTVEGSDTVYATLDCHDETLECVFVDLVVDNLPPGDKTVVLTTLDTAKKPFQFSKVSYQQEMKYRSICERVPLRLRLEYVKPFAITGLKYNAGEYAWDPIDLARRDDALPRSNQGVCEVEVQQRYPTFAVNYSDQNLENLQDYDIVIIDPRYCSRQLVKSWQDRGIQVFGYVTFGEEDDVPQDVFASEEILVPCKDDGGGPGGYASYYCKGGHNFAECNQCAHDCQIEGEKRCALGDAHYYAGQGACTGVCMHDWSQGFGAWDAGKPCKGGHTADDYWDRDEDLGCTNDACPDYKPYHGGCPQYENYEGWGQDLSLATPDFPDRNGIWSSSYVNPLAPRWKEKLQSYYLPWVFSESVQKMETVTLQKYTDAIDGTVSYVFQVRTPLDAAAPVVISTLDGTYQYQTYDFYYNNVTGAFWLDVNAGVDDGHPLAAGMQLQVEYWTLGINADGVIMDTVDTVDIYPSEEFKKGMADLINGLKGDFPEKMFMTNRGFTVVPQIIQSLHYTMFETFISEYDWRTGTYYRIDDPDYLEEIKQIKAMLWEMRRINPQYNIVAQNYCADGPEGDALRQEIMAECYAEGYLSWSSNILLDNPLPAEKFHIASDEWKEKVKPGNPFFANVLAVNRALAVKYQGGKRVESDASERIWVTQERSERDQWYTVKTYALGDSAPGGTIPKTQG